MIKPKINPELEPYYNLYECASYIQDKYKKKIRIDELYEWVSDDNSHSKEGFFIRLPYDAIGDLDNLTKNFNTILTLLQKEFPGTDLFLYYT